MKKKCDHIEDLYNAHKAGVSIVAVMLALFYIWTNDYPFIFPKESSAWLWLELMFFVLTVFTCKRWRLSTAVWLGVGMILVYSNKAKSDLIQYPVTEMDIKILAENPSGFFDALGVSRLYQYIGFVTVLIVVAYFTYKSSCRLFRNSDRKKNIMIELAVLIMIATFSFKIFSSFYMEYGDFIYENRSKFLSNLNLWAPDGMISASQRLTALGFLSYSHSADKQKQFNYIKNLKKTEKVVDREAIERVASKYLGASQDDKQLPNIVFILAESTFNPNSAFSLDKKVSNTLFNPSPGAEGGVMHVSAVGGGTWKTEFETVTGIDSRLFGFAGEYTHVSLSPYVKKSFASYLTNMGYDTRVFYPVGGHFYGARNAYKNYGFKRFSDAVDLDLEKDWSKFSDERMAERIIEEFPTDSKKPFYYYAVTLEAHSPYPCKDFDRASQFYTSFTADPDYDKNCKLNEYLLRVSSTEKGVEKIVNSLRSIEKKTGRPFIFAVFGDHQPHEFNHDEFDANRSSYSKFFTFYKIVKSESVHIPKLEKGFHATLIPSIVSTGIVSSPGNIYLPENFYIYEKCGTVADLYSCPDLSVLTSVYSQYIKGDWFK